MSNTFLKYPLSKIAIALTLAHSTYSYADLVQGNGNTGISVSSSGNHTTVTQNTPGTVSIQWNEFNIAADESVHFDQLESDIAINYIGQGSASEILGSISADGTIFLSNSNGFIFGAGASINTGAFLATTSNIDVTGGSVNLSSPGAGTISISDKANFNTETGYIAFISDSIVSDTSNSDPNLSSGIIKAKNNLLLSNDGNGTLQLSGLSIQFPLSGMSGSSSASTMNLDGLKLNANTIALSGHGLVLAMDSVVNMPETLAATNLVIHTKADVELQDTLGDSLTGSLENIFNDHNYLFSHMDIHYHNSNFLINDALNLNDLSSIKSLSIYADTNNSIVLSSDANIYGELLDLTLDANTVDFGISNNQLGGTSALNSLTVNATNDISIGRNIETNGDMTFNGHVTFNGDSEDGYIWSNSGNLTFNGDLFKSDSSKNINLQIGAKNLFFNEVSGFSNLEFHTEPGGTILLNSHMEADTLDFTNVSNIMLTNSLMLSANTINFLNNAIGGQHTLTLLGTGSENQFNLKNIQTTDSNSPLQRIIIDSKVDSSTTSIYTSGKIDAQQFCIIECQGPYTSFSQNSTFNLSLIGDTEFSAIQTLDLTQLSRLSDDYQLKVVGANSASSEAIFSSISNLGGLTIENMNQVTFQGNVETLSHGLNVTANSINVSPAGQSIQLSNTESGNIQLDGDISVNGSHLSILSQNSDITLGSITGFSGLTITNQQGSNGELTLNGSLVGNGNIAINDFGNVSMEGDNQDFTISTGNGTFKSKDSQISAIGKNVTIDAQAGIEVNGIRADSIHLYSNSTVLNADLIAEYDLNFFKDVNEDNVIDSADYLNTITLNNDVTLQGNMDILDPIYSAPSVSHSPAILGANFNLNLLAKNSDIYLTAFTKSNSLNALSITGEGIVHYDSLPNVTGVEGFSLLGNLQMEVGKDTVFDTSSFNGKLDFSGVSLIGSGSLTFKTGSGELNLGDIGVIQNTPDQEFTGLTIESTGLLRLHGDIVTSAEEYDFSKLNAIQLESNQTFGSEELALKNIKFGNATINGTYSLSLYSEKLDIGSIGNNIELQDLTIVSSGDITLDNDITLIGNANIRSNSLELKNIITSRGLSIDIETANHITMDAEAELVAKFGNVDLRSLTGNIALGYIYAGSDVTVRSEAGFISNAINDYVSNDNTSINIESTNQELYGLLNVGESVDNPIVINVLNNGTIAAESNGNVYIANLANAKIDSDSRVIDSASGGSIASTDALSQFNLSSLNTVNMPTLSSTLGLISNITWQVDEDESIRKIRTPVSSPAIYYSRKGWQLGQ